MSVHAVSFEFTQNSKFYDDYFLKIKTFGGYYEVHKTLWLVSTSGETDNNTVYNFLQNYTHKNDFVVVIKITGDPLKTIQGWANPQLWTWLRGQEI